MVAGSIPASGSMIKKIIARINSKIHSQLKQAEEDIARMTSQIKHLENCLEAERFTRANLMVDRDTWRNRYFSLLEDFKKRK